MTPRVIAFIPARCGSKSIPLKNIKPLNGKPLICWNITALLDCQYVDKIVVSTDCKEVANVVSDLDSSMLEVHHRSPQNAKDDSSTESVMLEYIVEANVDPEDIFMLVQATSPLTQTRHFDEAINLYLNKKCDSLLTCVRIKRFIWSNEGVSLNYNYLKRPRRQEFDGYLVENGAFYLNRVQNILKFRNRLSGNIGIYEMPEHTILEIDEPDDWIMAESLVKKYLITKPNSDQASKKL